ncbi:MAG TPA: HAD family hydrolase [Pseudonocardiaceae bacterium]|jgi:putative hydrolase of the HAD superfamily|nr:HAD family hydrolase [Pseudonocardiaceae bacterium]
MSVRAVVFDYFGTLTPTVVTMITAEEQAALGAALGVDPQVFEEAWRASFVERSTGRTGDMVATLRLLCERVGVAPSEDGLAEAARIRAGAYRRSATPRAETVDVLRELRRRGLRIAVVSDCSDELVAVWPSSPVAELVDTTVFSAVVGRRKPDPVMYRSACVGLGVAASECVYVGDGGSGELTGAVRFGMRAVLLADAEWAVGHRYDADEWDGEVIHQLGDVVSLV